MTTHPWLEALLERHDQVDAQIIEEMIALNAPDLEGADEKQVAWAERVRARCIAQTLPHTRDASPGANAAPEDVAYAEGVKQAMERLLAIRTAHFWVDFMDATDAEYSVLERYDQLERAGVLAGIIRGEKPPHVPWPEPPKTGPKLLEAESILPVVSRVVGSLGGVTLSPCYLEPFFWFSEKGRTKCSELEGAAYLWGMCVADGVVLVVSTRFDGGLVPCAMFASGAESVSQAREWSRLTVETEHTVRPAPPQFTPDRPSGIQFDESVVPTDARADEVVLMRRRVRATLARKEVPCVGWLVDSFSREGESNFEAFHLGLLL